MLRHEIPSFVGLILVTAVRYGWYLAFGTSWENQAPCTGLVAAGTAIPQRLLRRARDGPGGLAKVHPASGEGRASRAGRELGLSAAWHLLSALASCQRSPGGRFMPPAIPQPHQALPKPASSRGAWGQRHHRAQSGETEMGTRC